MEAGRVQHATGIPEDCGGPRGRTQTVCRSTPETNRTREPGRGSRLGSHLSGRNPLPVTPSPARFRAQTALASLPWLELLARGAPAAALVEDAAALATRTEVWDEVFDRVAYEQLAPRLLAVLAGVGAGRLPEAVGARVAASARTEAALALAWTHHLRHALEALAAGGVAPLLIKGAALGVLLEGSPEARRFGDIDLLVRRGERDRAARILRALGYAEDWPVPRHATSPMRSSQAVAFRAQDRPAVDLHWGLGTPLVPCRFEQSGVFARARRIDLGEGLTADTLGAEDTLLHLCFHGAKDDWAYWLNVADVSGLLRATPTLDFARLRRLAATLGLRRILRTGLRLAETLGDTRLPPDRARWVRADPTSMDSAHEARRRLRGGRPVPQSIRARLARATANRERWTDRALAVVGVLARVSSRGVGGVVRDLREDARPDLGGWTPPS